MYKMCYNSVTKFEGDHMESLNNLNVLGDETNWNVMHFDTTNKKNHIWVHRLDNPYDIFRFETNDLKQNSENAIDFINKTNTHMKSKIYQNKQHRDYDKIKI